MLIRIIHSEGTVLIKTFVNGESRITKLYPVVYYPEAQNRLLLIGKLLGNNCVLLSTKENTNIIHRKTNKVFYTGLPLEMSNPLLHWLLTLIWNLEKAWEAVFMSKTVDYDTWHFRMAHASKEVMRHMETHLKGVQIKGLSTLKVCKGCEMGQHISKSYPTSEKRATIILHLIHADLIELPV